MRISIIRVVLPALILTIMLASGCKKEEKDGLPVVKKEEGLRKDRTVRFLDNEGQTVRQISVQLATTPAEREVGLMHRRSIAMDEGMLFVFERAEPQSFWMHNTPVPLDIMFVGPDSTILNIVARTTPMSDAPVSSVGAARFVLETRAGFSEAFGIQPGMRVAW